MKHAPGQGVRFTWFCVVAALAGCAEDGDAALPPCSTPVVAVRELPNGSGPTLIETGALGPKSVAARLEAGCLRLAFSPNSSACGMQNSLDNWLELRVCDPRVGSFTIPSAASARNAEGERPAHGGVVVLDRYEPEVDVAGRFNAFFDGREVAGTFDALFCGSAFCE